MKSNCNTHTRHIYIDFCNPEKLVHNIKFEPAVKLQYVNHKHQLNQLRTSLQGQLLPVGLQLQATEVTSSLSGNLVILQILGGVDTLYRVLMSDSVIPLC